MATYTEEDKEYSFKLVVLGYYSVGKSSLVMNYVKGEFNPNEESTIGAAFLTKTIFSKGNNIKFEIWDTAGQERYNSLIPMYYRGAQVALVVYDITKRESFNTAKKWIEELTIEKPSDFLKVLIGNKIDLEPNRKIDFDEARLYAVENDLLFYETSAKTGYNIERVFTDIGELLPRVEKKKKTPVVEIQGDKKNFSCC
ncbi:hypothetical protein COBT_002130 [Conglomerata obtusa]